MPPRDSSRLLKAGAARGLGAKVAFNFEDLRDECEAYLVRVREQARQILQNAKQDAEELRRTTFEAARTSGHAAGMRDAEREVAQRAEAIAEQRLAQRMQSALPALQSIVSQLTAQRDEWLANWESNAVRLCVAVGEKLVRTRIQVRPDAATEMISEALRLAAGNPHVAVRIHPDDLAAFGEQADDVIRTLAACSDIKVVPQEDIARGGCLIETRQGVIDARLETMAARIAEELLQG